MVSTAQPPGYSAPVPIADELHAALSITDRKARAHATLALIDTTMTTLGFTKVTVPPETRPIDRARDLNDAQRDGLLALAQYPQLSLARYPVPGTAWAIRQWLGAEPPGPLFADDAALYSRLHGAPDTEAIAMLVALPMPKRLYAVADAYLLHHDLANCHSAYLLGSRGVVPPEPDIGRGTALVGLANDSGDWADTMATRIIEIEDAPPLYSNNPSLGATLYLPVLLAHVRAGRVLDSRYDRFLAWLLHRSTDAALVHECIAAIPEARREAALATALALRGPEFCGLDPIFVADELLARYPYPSVVRAVLKNPHAFARGKRTLRALSRSHPAVAAELAAHERAIPKLKITNRKTAPTLAELDEAARDQLAQSGTLSRCTRPISRPNVFARAAHTFARLVGSSTAMRSHRAQPTRVCPRSCAQSSRTRQGSCPSSRSASTFATSGAAPAMADRTTS